MVEAAVVVMVGTVVVVSSVYFFLVQLVKELSLAESPTGQVFVPTGMNLLGKKSLHTVQGVTRLQPRGWQLHGNFSGFRVPRSKAENFLHKFYGDFSLRLNCGLLASSRGSVVTLRHPHHKLPYLNVRVDLQNNALTLR